MTDNFESELAEKFELVAEGYWVSGMTLSAARARAAKELGQQSGQNTAAARTHR